MWDFIESHRAALAFGAYQHVSLVVQSVLLATVVALVLAVVVHRQPRLAGIANGVSSVGLTVPSLAMLAFLLAVLGLGVLPSVVAIAFYAALPILRNTVVGLAGVDRNLVESARGMGMGPIRTLVRVELPLAWPVVLTGVRVSTQMCMGVAAVAAYVQGPGLGSYIFNGLARLGGAGAVESALVGTLGVVLLALALDGLLVLLRRATTSRGIRV
jgi:osmoprotectant transport system permease protein